MAGGRPRLYDSEEEMQNEINKYFYDCTANDEPLTITGLALHLGFESRQSILDYEKNDKFSCTIKRARMRIENSYEKMLQNNSPTGAIFALKNFGWKDRQELDHTTNGKDISPPINWIGNE